MAGTIFFVLSKVLGVLLRPESWLVAALVVALRKSRRGRRRAARRWTFAALAGVVLLSAYPLGEVLVRPLETHHPPAPLPDRVDGIVVLGGAVQAELSRINGQPAVNDAAERILAGLMLAQRFPDARLVYTGGSGRLLNQEDKGATAAAELMVAAGLDPGRLIVEDRARNTWENAVFSKPMARPAPGEVWLLVTSAFHMPRSVGVFCAAGWPVVPYPVDYRGGLLDWLPGWNLPDHADLLHMAIKEWIGLVAYRLTGRSATCEG